MAGASISQVESGVTKSLEEMIQRGKSVSAYLNRVLLRKFQKAQIERWKTENQSEKEKWQPLTPAYKTYKLKKFASYPGGGRSLMIATGRLASGAQARDAAYFYKIVSDSQFVIGINTSALPYSVYPGEMRPYMEFSDETLQDWKAGIRSYICKGES